jgi:hypothetical protein
MRAFVRLAYVSGCERVTRGTRPSPRSPVNATARLVIESALSMNDAVHEIRIKVIGGTG